MYEPIVSPALRGALPCEGQRDGRQGLCLPVNAAETEPVAAPPFKQPIDVIEDSALVPHRRECSWNDTYSWGRDGSQYWQVPTARDEAKAYRLSLGFFEDWWEQRYYERNPRALARDTMWPPDWYRKLIRK